MRWRIRSKTTVSWMLPSSQDREPAEEGQMRPASGIKVAEGEVCEFTT